MGFDDGQQYNNKKETARNKTDKVCRWEHCCFEVIYLIGTW